MSNKSITDTSHQNGKPTSWYKSSVGEHNPADQVLQVGKNCETDETNLSRVRDDIDGGGDDLHNEDESVTIMMFLVVAFQNGVDCEKLLMKVNPILHFLLCSETPR